MGFHGFYKGGSQLHCSLGCSHSWLYAQVGSPSRGNAHISSCNAVHRWLKSGGMCVVSYTHHAILWMECFLIRWYSLYLSNLFGKLSKQSSRASSSTIEITRK